MKLRKLLLGSAATIMVAGAASVPAKATDVNGLVTTAANYLESCSSGRGIQFTDWCLLFTGNSTATARFGWVIDYGATPAGNTYALYSTPGFNLTNTFGVRATRTLPGGQTVTVNFPNILGGGGSASLVVAQPGGWTATFTSTSFTLRLPSEIATWTLRLGEGDTFPDWPDIDVTGAFDFGDIDVTARVGYGYTDEDVNGGAVARFANPDAEIEIDAGFGDFSLTFGAHWAKVWNGGLVNALGVHGEIGAEFGDITLTFGAAWAHDGVANSWGVRGEIEGDFGDFGANLGVAYSVFGAVPNSVTDDFGIDDFADNYEYDINPGDRIWSVWGGLSFGATTLDLTTAWSPDLAQSFHGEAVLSHVLRPFGTGLTITPRAGYQFAQDGVGGWLHAFSAGVTVAVPINQ